MTIRDKIRSLDEIRSVEWRDKGSSACATRLTEARWSVISARVRAQRDEETRPGHDEITSENDKLARG